MKQLKNEILEVKKEKEREIQERSEMIAHLKDQLQELKGKSSCLRRYTCTATSRRRYYIQQIIFCS